MMRASLLAAILTAPPLSALASLGEINGQIHEYQASLTAERALPAGQANLHNAGLPLSYNALGRAGFGIEATDFCQVIRGTGSAGFDPETAELVQHILASGLCE